MSIALRIIQIYIENRQLFLLPHSIGFTAQIAEGQHLETRALAKESLNYTLF